MGLASADCSQMGLCEQSFGRRSLLHTKEEKLQETIVKKLSALSVFVDSPLNLEVRNSELGSGCFCEAFCYCGKLDRTYGCSDSIMMDGGRDMKNQMVCELSLNEEETLDREAWPSRPDSGVTEQENNCGQVHAGCQGMQPAFCSGKFALATELPSSSYSMSDSFNGSSSQKFSQLSDESDAESTFDLYSKHCTRGLSPGKKSLSIHFNGKSRSFTTLADVENVKSIQELAKPERFCHSRRKARKLKSFPLHSVEKSIGKQNQRGRSKQAVSLALKCMREGSLLGPMINRDAGKNRVSGLPVRSVSMVNLYRANGSNTSSP